MRRPLADLALVSYNPEIMDGNDILRLAGEALYGRQWQAPLSRDLGVTDRTVRNWAGGLNRPADIADRIVPLLRTRAEQLAHIIALAERHQNR